MIENEHNAATSGDDWVEGLLRADAREHDDEYLADEGFTARVMQAIPAPAALPAWRKPVLAGLWGLAGIGIAVALPGTAKDVAYDALHLLASYTFSVRDIAVLVLGIAAASWAGTLYTIREER